jgi:preprotein translocase subunit SecA
MFPKLIEKVFGNRNERELKSLSPLVNRVNALESKYQAMSDEALLGQTVEFKQRLENGEPLDDLLPETFAVVREVSIRTTGMRHFDVQILGGIVLHQGKIAEMKTGEGKTLVATLPIYLNGLEGLGAHVVTVNDYLAARDAEWMGAIYNGLGMSVGTVLSGDRNDKTKRAAYAADITYCTNNEFGFDYLRDNMKFRIEDYVQRGHRFGIVDEVDSILVDEARTPLIISGPTSDNTDLYYVIDGVIPLLQEEIDFIVDEKNKGVVLSDEGMDKLEAKLGVDNLYDPHNMKVLHHVNQALRAHTMFKRDRDYVVREGKVTIVDEHTGRLMHGRRWSDGLHQAIEAKERTQVEAESQTYATITFQNLFRMYDKLSGMTGTAATEAEEFMKIYELDVLVMPTNVPLTRADHDDVVYKTQMEKFTRVMEEIRDCRETGQPVLVGTTSVEKSEILHQLLKRADIEHEVLNAKNHAREAHIITQAGRKGSVTISTNMAGRGTDIKLGGDPVGLAAEVADAETDPEGYAAALKGFTTSCEAERLVVLEAGGLHIIGTERHESRRIDNQLRGRSGRQGDPGSSRFYLSLEDDLLRIFGSEKIIVWMERMGLEDDEPIEHRWITKSIENAQKKVEGHHFNVRKNLLEYDDVLNHQREAVYDLRKRALTGESIREMMLSSIENLADDFMSDFIADRHPEDWEIEGMKKQLSKIFGLNWEEDEGELRDYAFSELRQRILDDVAEIYGAKEEDLGEEALRQVERMLTLQFTDQLWKDHLLAMDRLRDGIGLRGYGQRNPLLEYKKEGFNMFQEMCAIRDEQIVSSVLRVELTPQVEAAAQEPSKGAARRLARGTGILNAGGLRRPAVAPKTAEAPPVAPPLPALQAAAQARAAASDSADARPPKGILAKEFGLANKWRRNDPCPCGSGRKFKKCCYLAEGESPSA